MTSLPAAFVRTSLVFLVAGFAMGGWMMLAQPLALPVPAGMRLMHVHFLTVGFFTCMVMGVALWMFPAPPGEGREGIAARQPWGWAAYWLLVGGLVLRAAVTFAPGSLPASPARLAIGAAAAAQVAAAVCFSAAVWVRTRPRPFVRTPAAPPRPPRAR